MTAHKKGMGTLIPIGGNEDKGGAEDEYSGLDYIEEGILSHVVRESGGSDAKILVVPTASSIPDEVAQNYVDALNLLGCTNLTILNIRERSQSDSPEILKHISEARCVLFSGGDQSKISDLIGQSKMHKMISNRFLTENLVVAGTSAGAMAMCEEMIAGGSSQEAFIKGAVIMREGLGLIPEVVIDTHFIKRGRFGRLAEAVATYPKLIGIGLAEDTGLIVKNCNEFRVIGSGMVIVFDAGQLTHNYHDILKEGTPMSMSNLITHVLSNGDRFRLDDRSIAVLPLEEAFI
jgi:cyanophycinase